MARKQLVDWAKQWLVDWMAPDWQVDKLGGTTGKGDRLSNPGFQYGEIKPQSL